MAEELFIPGFKSLTQEQLATQEGVRSLNETLWDLARPEIYWDDVRVPAGNAQLGPGKTEPAFEVFQNGVYVYKFDTSNADDESLHFVSQLPHGYKQGTDILPHVHWSPDNTNTGNVYWSLEYTISNVNGTFPATTTLEVLDAGDGTQYKHQVVGLGTIGGEGIQLSAMIVGRITRRSTSQATDTYTGNACFLEIDFHIQKDSRGSRQEYIK